MERAGNPTPNVLLMLSMALGRGGSCTWQRQAFGLGERTLPRSSPRVNITSKSPRPALPPSLTEVSQRCRPEDAQRLTAAGRTARHWRRGFSAQPFEARRWIARYPKPNALGISCRVKPDKHHTRQPSRLGRTSTVHIPARRQASLLPHISIRGLSVQGLAPIAGGGLVHRWREFKGCRRPRPCPRSQFACQF